MVSLLSRARSATAAILAVLLVAAGLTVAAAAVNPSRAQAAGTPAFDCSLSSPTIYSLVSNATAIDQVNTGTGAETRVATFTGAPLLNGLAISQNGLQAWAIEATPETGGVLHTPTIYEYDTATATTSSFAGPSMSATGATGNNIVMGGINPKNGVYYFGILRGGSLDIYGFDTGAVSGLAPHAITAATGTDNRIAIVAVGTDSAGNTRINGDLVFDSVGRLVFVASSGGGVTNSNVLDIIATPLGNTATHANLTPKTIANLTPRGDGFNGITFGGDGFLYVQYGNTNDPTTSTAWRITKVDPNTGATIATNLLSGAGSPDAIDLASCTYNNALSAQKNIVSRYAATDQFRMTITDSAGGGLVGNTGTTTGTTTGLQTAASEIAGPLVGVGPSTYTITETGVGGANLANYITTYSCTDTLNPGFSLTGTGSKITLPYPAPTNAGGRNVVCTFSNGTLTTTKAISTVNGQPATPATVIHAGDVIKYAITTMNPGVVATPTTLTETVPAGTTYTGSGEGWTSTCTTGASTCTQIVTPANGGSTTVFFTVTANSLASNATTIVNAVTSSFGLCPSCSVTNPVLGSFTVKKTASVASAKPGEQVTYTVTITPSGPSIAAATVTDNLADVLDDAFYVAGSANASSGTATVNVAAKTLTWNGPLNAAPVTVTYTVQVNNPDAGTDTLINVVTPGPNGSCLVAADCTTTTPVTGSYTVKKTVSASTAKPGDTLTYTITVTDVGAPVPGASFTDDLTNVIDDATFVAGSQAASSGSATFVTPKLTWTGSLTTGQVVTVTYNVTVKNPDTGNHTLINAVVPGTNGSCVLPTDCTTTTPVGSYVTVKKASESSANPGDKVTYTITVTNTGGLAYTTALPASFSDSLSQVLDDAGYNNDAVASGGTVSYTDPTLSWSGALPLNATVTVTYSVTVNSPDTGDHKLVNTVVTPSEGGCPTGSSDPDCTTNVPVSTPVLAWTGSDSEFDLQLAALLLIVGGLAVLAGRRRRPGQGM